MVTSWKPWYYVELVVEGLKMRVTAVQDSLVLPYIDPHSQKYKSITKYQGFRHLTFVLYRRGRHESANQLRSIKGFGI